MALGESHVSEKNVIVQWFFNFNFGWPSVEGDVSPHLSESKKSVSQICPIILCRHSIEASGLETKLVCSACVALYVTEC